MSKRFLKKILRQTAVYWASPVNDGYGGFTFDDPVELDVRWEDVQQLFVTPQGEQKVSRAVVYVDQDMDIGGYLFLGNLGDLDSAQLPLPQDGAMVILGYSKSSDVAGKNYLRKVWL